MSPRRWQHPLRGRIPRVLRDHRSQEGLAYRAYCLAVIARLGPLPADARPWLKEAGRLTLDLDHLRAEAEDVRQVLVNGSGRRARNKARVTLRQLERRAGRLRVALAAVEDRLAALAAGTGHAARVPTPSELLASLQADLSRSKTFSD
jgi:hypothetical protein